MGYKEGGERVTIACLLSASYVPGVACPIYTGARLILPKALMPQALFFCPFCRQGKHGKKEKLQSLYTTSKF